MHIERAEAAHGSTRRRRAQGWFKVTYKFENGGEKLLGEHADWDAHKAAEEPYLAAEEDRLLYVAATRAREMLVVSRFSGSGRKNPAWGALDDNLASAKELPIPKAVTVAEPMPLACSAEAQAEHHRVREAADAAVIQPSWSVTSVTAEAKHIARMTAKEEPAAADDATRVVAQDTPSHRADAGMAWGTLIHGLLEHAMRHPATTREDLRRLALWLTVEEPQLREVIEQAIDTVETAAKAQFWAQARDRVHSEETPFLFADSAALTAGVIDLLFEGTGGWRVIDYKTDRALEATRYERQLDAYRRALQSVGCAVTGTAVVSVRTEPV